jgi:hypothetical protein
LRTNSHLSARLSFAALLLGLLSAVSFTQTPGPSTQKKPGREVNPGMYLPPNEQHPAVALPIWQQSNHQTYVSVGTERSFIGAAVTGASALVVVDYDPNVVKFAEINRALLATSRSREDYLALRLTAPAAVWQERAAALSPEDAKALRQSWDFWDKNVRQNTGAWSAAFEHFNTQAEKPTAAFAQVNYLYDDQLFAHLHHLATTGQIWTRVLDLRDHDAVEALCGDLRQHHMQLGVVDTSNVPDASEAGSAAAGNYVSWFLRCAEDATLFLFTERANRQSVSYWSYFAFSGKALRGRDPASITSLVDAEITKLKQDPDTRALLDDPDVLH